MTVLFENDTKNDEMLGFTENYIRVKAPYDPKLVNKLKTVQLQKIDRDGLVLVSEPALVEVS